MSCPFALISLNLMEETRQRRPGLREDPVAYLRGLALRSGKIAGIGFATILAISTAATAPASLPTLAALYVFGGVAYNRRHSIASRVRAWRAARTESKVAEGATQEQQRADEPDVAARQKETGAPNLDTAETPAVKTRAPRTREKQTASQETATPGAEPKDAGTAAKTPVAAAGRSRQRSTAAAGTSEQEKEKAAQPVQPATPQAARKAPARASAQKGRTAAQPQAASGPDVEPATGPSARGENQTRYFGQVLSMISTATSAPQARAFAAAALLHYKTAPGKEATMYRRALDAISDATVELDVIQTFAQGTLDAYPPQVMVAPEAAKSGVDSSRAAALARRSPHAPAQRTAAPHTGAPAAVDAPSQVPRTASKPRVAEAAVKPAAAKRAVASKHAGPASPRPRARDSGPTLS